MESKKFRKAAIPAAIALIAAPQVYAAEAPSNEEMWRILQELKRENQELRRSVNKYSRSATRNAESTKRAQPTDTELARNSGASDVTGASTVDVSVGGFIWAEYGNGGRYSEADGEDRLGVSKSALSATAQYENVTGVLAVGTELFTGADENGTFDGNVDIKDAFIKVENIGDTPFGFSIGAQPLLFGLKPNGYPGDRSLQASIEYGGAGAFAVSNQLGPSIIGFFDFGESANLRFGTFDLSDQAVLQPGEIDDGAQVIDSYFVQLRSDNIAGTGLYGNVGYEELYIGETGESEPLWTAGLGWRNQYLDLSVEYIAVDQAIAEANVGLVSGGSQFAVADFNDDEEYVVAEVTVNPNEHWSLYADYAQADQLDAETVRVGATYRYNKALSFTVEYSDDDVTAFNTATSAFNDDNQSIDFRVTLQF